MSSGHSHPFHLIEPSKWPILSSFSMLFVAAGFIMFMHEVPHAGILLSLGLLSITICVFSWFSDVIKEGRVDKAHNKNVQLGLKIGMMLFIVSEIMFFFGFFWSYFKSSLSPMDTLDGFNAIKGIWPPKGIETFDPWHIPFLNTLILLLSGTTVTWAHYALEENNQEDLKRALFYTVLLGVSFTCCQAYEYFHAPFHFKDGIYPSNFFMATGFHGFHVIVGTIFLAVCYFRAKSNHFVPEEGHLGFEFAAWYWHFVDVVWLFLFLFVYVLGR
jgi:cytochrome c oxidase subunit 3